jgi:hypothetical protein
MMYVMSHILFNINKALSDNDYELKFSKTFGGEVNFQPKLDECNQYLQQLGIQPINRVEQSSSQGLTFKITPAQALGITMFLQTTSMSMQLSEDERAHQYSNVREFVAQLEKNVKIEPQSKLSEALRKFKLDVDPEAKAVNEYNVKVMRLLNDRLLALQQHAGSGKGLKGLLFDDPEKLRQREASMKTLIARANEEMSKGTELNIYALTEEIKGKDRSSKKVGFDKKTTGVGRIVGAKSEFTKMLDEIDKIPKPSTQKLDLKDKKRGSTGPAT